MRKVRPFITAGCLSAIQTHTTLVPLNHTVVKGCVLEEAKVANPSNENNNDGKRCFRTDTLSPSVAYEYSEQRKRVFLAASESSDPSSPESSVTVVLITYSEPTPPRDLAKHPTEGPRFFRFDKIGGDFPLFPPRAG